ARRLQPRSPALPGEVARRGGAALVGHRIPAAAPGRPVRRLSLPRPHRAALTRRAGTGDGLARTVDGPAPAVGQLVHPGPPRRRGPGDAAPAAPGAAG